MDKGMIRAGLAATALFAGAIGTAQAVIIDFSTCSGGTSGLTTCVSGASVTTFDATAIGALPTGYTGNGAVRQGSLSGQYAAPAGNSTPYLSVPSNGSSGTVTLSLSNSYNYFGLYWGSIDDYNSLRFFNEGGLVASVGGAEVVTALNLLGNQTNAGSNRYVDFFFGNLSFNRIEFVSNGYAFETDNHAVANVPEPGTLALFGAGLLAAGFMRRRRLQVETGA